LAEAGYPNGKGLPELTFYTIPSAFYLAEYVQAKLRQFGMQIKIEVNNGPGHIALLNLGQAKIFRLRWLADYPDAENYLALFNSKNLAPGPNKTRYTNLAYDSLYSKACAEKNDTIRQNLYQEMEQIIMNDAVVIPIYYDEALQLSSKKVIGRLRGGAYNFKLEKIDVKLSK
jgi:peptide/nickel transport system substrate-binding protein